MYNIAKQSQEQKRKLQKINMIMNNLEQQLCEDEELCRGVAKIINMSIESEKLVERLESKKSNILTMEQRRLDLIKECLLSCSETRENIGMRIINMLEENGKKDIPAKMVKIHSTIDTCIANYSLYKQSEYYAKYGSSEDSVSNLTSLSDEELLLL